MKELVPAWVSPSTGYPLSRLSAFMGLPRPWLILVDRVPPLWVTFSMVCLLYGLLTLWFAARRVTPSMGYPLYRLPP